MRSARIPKTVMVVEDDEGVRLLLTEVLEGSGYRVFTYCNPLEALEAARQSPPDAIILDWYLPFLTGRDFLTHLDQLCQAPPPVIVLTGDVTLKAPKGTEVLTKPVGLDVLLERIAALTGAEPMAPDTGWALA
jgi:DNA-binding response OmpR family regulator